MRCWTDLTLDCGWLGELDFDVEYAWFPADSSTGFKDDFELLTVRWDDKDITDLFIGSADEVIKLITERNDDHAY